MILDQFSCKQCTKTYIMDDLFLIIQIPMKQQYLEEIYTANKKLDDKFDIIYADVKNLNDCNKIELMAELMELANSTRVFKYRKKKPMDYEEAIYEYADWLAMLFYFFNIADKKIELKSVDSDIDTVSLFLKLIDLYNEFINKDADNLNEILSWYVLLWQKIGFKEDDILNTTLDKIAKTTEYLNWLEQ